MNAPIVETADRTKLVAQLVWASGSFATGAVFNAVALFGLFFMTNFMGVAPVLAGSILLIVRLYDAVINPLIGAISDRTIHRWGPRRLYLLIGGLGLGASFALFFNLARLSVQGAVSGLLVTAVLILYSTAYSIFSIPYLAMPPEIAPGYDERTRLMSFRVFFLLVGVTAGSVGAPLLVALGGGEQHGYETMGIIIGIAATALCLLVFFGSASLPQSPRLNRQPSVNLRGLLLSPFVDTAQVFSNAPFRYLTLVKLCQLAVLSTVLSCTPYFFGFVLKMNAAQIGRYFAVFSAAGLLSVPVFRWLIAQFGKRECYIVLLTIYGLGLASWYLWRPGESDILFFVRAIIIGAFSTGTLLCALSMLPDTMEYDRLQSGESREGVISGVFTFVENLAGALGPFIIGLLLQARGLIRSHDPSVIQPPAVLSAVQIGVSLVPALFCLIAIPLLFLYRLDNGVLESMRKERAAQ